MIFLEDQLYTYFKNNFIDDNGTVLASLNGNRRDVVVDDKRLIDSSLALIIACKQNDMKLIQKLVSGMNLFRDKKYEGFLEITDKYGAKYDEGTIKHLLNQILATFSLYLATRNRNLTSDDTDYKERLNSLLSNYINNNGELFLQDWSIVNYHSTLKTAAVCFLISNYIKSDPAAKSALLAKCQQFYVHDRYYSVKSGNQILNLSGTKLSDLGLMLKVMAISKNVELAQKIITFIYDHYRITLNGGLWNKVGSNPEKLVDSSASYLLKDSSPFPYKDILSQIIVLSGIKNFPHLKYVRELKQLIEQTLFDFYDRKNGGFFIGQGFWFANPKQPSVPLDRHVLVPAHTLGSFAVGNTSYVPFHEKLAIVQEIGVLLLDSSSTHNTRRQLITIPYSQKKPNYKLNYISQGILTHSYIKIDNYLSWLGRTISGYGYGLTPYRSPLAIKSDKTPQNFSALHVISDLTVLHHAIYNKYSLSKVLETCQNSDGGFGEQPALLSEVFTTYCVVAALFILKDENFDKQQCIKFIVSCQNPDGSFGNAPGYPGDAWHTHLAVLALHLLKAEENYDTDKCIEYLLNCQNPDGAFGLVPGSHSETYSTFRSVDSLKVLGVVIPKSKQTILWLKSRQDKSGGFHYGVGKPVSFVGSYHAIAALYILGSLPDDVDQCKKWLANHQTPDGGFGNDSSMPSLTTDEGFVILQASYMLEKKLNPYWAEIIT